MRNAPRVLLAAALTTAVLALAAAIGDPAPTEVTPSAREVVVTQEPDDGLTGTLTVFAAASLTETFTELGDMLMADNPDLTVVFSFAGSSALAAQIVSGAAADVFAAASPATMQTVVDDAGGALTPEVFVRNTLQIAVPAGNPAGITGLADFARPELAIALCAPEVPCGAAAEKVFAAAGVTASPDTLEQDVKAALSKVALGEVDGALVYRTDAIAAAGEVQGIEFAEASSAVNDYPIVVLDGAGNPEAARAFVALVLSPEGQDVLGGAGFDHP
jgi:molybdate transport system substrate-binding protein